MRWQGHAGRFPVVKVGTFAQAERRFRSTENSTTVIVRQHIEKTLGGYDAHGNLRPIRN